MHLLPSKTVRQLATAVVRRCQSFSGGLCRRQLFLSVVTFLQDIRVYITPGTSPGPEALARIVKAAGGQVFSHILSH